MAQYRFKADETRIFGDLSLEIAPGDVHDFDGDPPSLADWWEPVDEAAPAADVAAPVDAPPADTSAPAVPADQAEE